MEQHVLEEQIAYYTARAQEYDASSLEATEGQMSHRFLSKDERAVSGITCQRIQAMNNTLSLNNDNGLEACNKLC
jgi:hypothetical protein